MARQPIFDRKGKVEGFELLYREAKGDESAGGDGFLRTAKSIEALFELGLERLVGDVKAYLNVDFGYMDFPVLEIFPSNKVVLEVLESTEPSNANLDKARNLVANGFTIALDDYAFQPGLEPFLQYAKIVKLECQELDPGKHGPKIRRLIGSGKIVLAEKLEEVATYKKYRDIGCHLFQGFYFAKPCLIEGDACASNKTALMNLLAKIYDENVTLRELETLVASDVTFTYKLMKLVHSAVLAAPPQVQTVGQAIQFLGLRSTAAIASVLALSAIPGRPSQLLIMALARGKMCEELARKAGHPEPDSFFTVGLLSVLDAFMDKPMEEIANELPLAPKLSAALSGQDSEEPHGQALECTKAYERGDFSKADLIGYDPAEAQAAYGSAIHWADTTFEALKAA